MIVVGLLLLPFVLRTVAAKGSVDIGRQLLSSAATTTASSLCSSRDDFRFKRVMVLTFNGRPGKLANGDITSLQDRLIKAYDQAAVCSNMPGGFLKLSKVTIARNEVNSFGSTVSQTASANITQRFKVIATAQGACRGCNASPFQLFKKSTSRRELAQTVSTLSSKTSVAGNRGGSAGAQKKKTGDDKKKPAKLSCKCPPPKKSSVVKIYNTKFLPPSIDSLVEISELQSRSPCPTTERTFETFITLEFNAGTQSLANVTDLQAQLKLLQQAVLQSYNDLNALSTGNVCDNFFVTLTDAQVTVAPGSATFGTTSQNRRFLAQSYSVFNRNFIVSIKGKCRSCLGNPPKLFNDVSGRRGQLNDWTPTTSESDVQSNVPQASIDVVVDENNRRHLRRLPVVDGGCYCPVNTTEFRSPTTGEFLSSLNSRLGLLESAGLISIVGLATDTFQDVAVNCSLDVNFFQETVEVSFASSIGTGVTSSQADQLAQAFQAAYNNLAQQFCDPLFRTVESVQLVRRRAGVAATTTVKLVFTVRGRCRSCGSSTSLYNDAVGRGRLLLDASVPIIPVMASEFQASTSHQQAHGCGQNRHLQEGNTTGQCYCNLDSLGNRAPTKAEFAAAYNQTLISLNISFRVITVNQTSVIINPSAPPTPFPTRTPRAPPTRFPTQKPSAPPTRFPTQKPSAPPSVNGNTLLVIGNTSRIKVSGCNDKTVVLTSNSSGFLAGLRVGSIIWAIPSGNNSDEICSPCANLVRIVKAVSRCLNTTTPCRQVTTTKGTLKDIMTAELLGDLGILAAANATIEFALTSSCNTTSARRRMPESAKSSHELRSTKDRDLFELLEFLLVPRDCQDWLKVDSLGVCQYTGCNVGRGGNPNNCFPCNGGTCDNGCGPAPTTPTNALINALIPESIPGLFDFTEVCCIHDYCYSSVFSKEGCDLAFLYQGLLSCAKDSHDIIDFLTLPIPKLGTNVPCEVTALIYYLALAFFGGDAHEQGRSDLEDHLVSSTCLAGRWAKAYRDPHILTFDGLAYDCQANGEFRLVNTRSANLEIQAKFSGNAVTLIRAVAATYDDSSEPVQVTIAPNFESNATSITSCPILFHFDGEQKVLSFGKNKFDTIAVVVSETEIVVTKQYVGSIQSYPSAGVEMRMRIENSNSFGCFINLNVFLPDKFAANEQITGLLGTPNNNGSDEWMNASGSAIAAFSIPNYQYCTTNWCLRDASDSWFIHNSNGSSFNGSSCDDPDRSIVNLANASIAVQRLCGGDKSCLLEGIFGDIDDANATLQEQADADRRRSSSSPLQFNPAVIGVGINVQVLVTVDASYLTALNITPSAFALYRVDPLSGIVQSSLLVLLQDNGSGLNKDEVAGDGLFSNTLAVRAITSGQVFGFRAVPIISGLQNLNSPLALTALSAIRSYSGSSGIAESGNVTDGGGDVKLPSLTGLRLAIAYSWPGDQKDLDTGTQFLGGKVGFNCGSATLYMSWPSGDNTQVGGLENVIVLLDDARRAGLWNSTTSVILNAGWFSGAGGSGPALVSIVLVEIATLKEVPGTSLSMPIEPGFQAGCSTTRVGEVKVSVGTDVTIQLVK